ncbi:hypothetical protein Pdw03_5729 [Penicillium digitatum]|uniref:Uncharacterized protein n=1 Tax=Penicillium digitatum TaxID=36651 RepID=A0A7T7BQ87_PENDI|nr:hypothetical protein Pdw03_5729 [Penicillium digitatum]
MASIYSILEPRQSSRSGIGGIAIGSIAVTSSFFGCGENSDFPMRGTAAIILTSATSLQLRAAARAAADGASAVARLRRVWTMSRSRLVYAVHVGIGITMLCAGQLRFA